MVESDDFSPRSRLIITGRDKGFIESAGLGFHIHELQKLDDDVSKELFCLSAFEKEEPPAGSSKYLQGIVRKCWGLPLALTIIGEYLSRFQQNEAVWEGAFTRLREAKRLNGHQDDGLWSVLEPSYQSLGDDEKEIFLDAAVCFHGESLKDVRKFWRARRNTPENAWKNLLDLHFVSEVREHQIERVHVHEVLRDLGRRLAGLGRMWVSHAEEVAKLSEEEAQSVQVVKVSGMLFPFDVAELTKLQGLWLDNATMGNRYGTDISSLPGFCFKEMRCLRAEAVTSATQLNAIFEMGSLQSLFLSIFKTRWLELRVLPTGEKLSSALWAKLGNLQQLQQLEISYCPDRIIGKYDPKDSFGDGDVPYQISERTCRAIVAGFEKLGGLRHLTLSGFEDLAGSGREIGNLRCLQFLKISNCVRLGAVPTDICNLWKLESLTISSCYESEKLPREISNLGVLQTLKISECHHLKAVPTDIGKLWTLRSLKISGCTDLEMIPAEISGLTKLETLQISGCRRVRWSLTEIGRLKNLKSLRIPLCDTFQVTPLRVGQLQKSVKLCHLLDRSRCANLMAVSADMGNLCKLELMEVAHHVRLVAVGKEADDEESRHTLDISWDYDPIEIPAQLNQLQNSKVRISYSLELEHITASHFKLVRMSFERPAWSHRYGGPREIVIMSCGNLMLIPSGQTDPDKVGYSDRPKALTISRCAFLEAIHPDLVKLEHLESLTISECRNLRAIPSQVAGFRWLKSLSICGCLSLEAIPPVIRELPRLSSLVITGCQELRAIPSELGGSIHLKSILIFGCPNLKAIPPEIAHLMWLESLEIHCCGQLKVIPSEWGHDRPRFSRLSVNISGCPKLVIHEEALETIRERGSASIVDGNWSFSIEETFKDRRTSRKTNWRKCNVIN